jgi:hypothetical protein
MGQSSKNPNGSANHNPKKPAELEGMKGKQQGHFADEVLFEDITKQSKMEGEEDKMT